MTEPCDLSATEASSLIATRRLSPRELLASCVRRIEAVNPTLNAITSMDLEAAEAAASRAEEPWSRAAIPLVRSTGSPSGSRISRTPPDCGPRTGRRSSPITFPIATNGSWRRSARPGAIVVGKTNVPEWGAGANSRNPVTGATGNPFNPLLTCGGSSGGSAVALATGMVPLATGSDTGGSLRNPASFCGVVGFRPSPGVVPVELRALGWTPISVSGPMGRTVDDAALLLSAIAGYDTRDPLSGPHRPVDLPGAATFRPGLTPRRDLRGPRIRAGRRGDPCHVQGARGAIRAPVSVVRAAPLALDGADLAFEVVRAASFSRPSRRSTGRPRRCWGRHPRQRRAGPDVTLSDFAEAHRRHTEIYRDFEDLFDDVDATDRRGGYPFPISTLPDQIDGPVRTYSTWLAHQLRATLTTASVVADSPVPARSLRRCRSGSRSCGRRGGDVEVLGGGAPSSNRCCAGILSSRGRCRTWPPSPMTAARAIEIDRVRCNRSRTGRSGSGRYSVGERPDLRGVGGSPSDRGVFPEGGNREAGCRNTSTMPQAEGRSRRPEPPDATDRQARRRPLYRGLAGVVDVEKPVHPPGPPRQGVDLWAGRLGNATMAASPGGGGGRETIHPLSVAAWPCFGDQAILDTPACLRLIRWLRIAQGAHRMARRSRRTQARQRGARILAGGAVAVAQPLEAVPSWSSGDVGPLARRGLVIGSCRRCRGPGRRSSA